MTDKYFQKALWDFTFEAACGGAIRHLSDLGYTARQITEKLSFSVSYDRVRRAYTKYLLEKEILLMYMPSEENPSVKVTYVQEFGKYGKPSFRRVEIPKEKKESILNTAHSTTKRDLKKAEMGYIPCEFGISKELFQKQLLVLEPDQKEYLEGICWEPKIMYHLLDERMKGIVKRLSEAGLYEGERLQTVHANGLGDNT